jgi:hypothetical protein
MLKDFNQRAFNEFWCFVDLAISVNDSIKEQKVKAIKLNKGDQSTCKKGMTVEEKSPNRGTKPRNVLKLKVKMKKTRDAAANASLLSNSIFISAKPRRKSPASTLTWV